MLPIMSQNVKPQSINSQTIKPQAIEFQSQETADVAMKMNVDALLDDVFGDIERLLAQDGSLSAHPKNDGSAQTNVGTAIEPFRGAIQADAQAINSAITNAAHPSTPTSAAPLLATSSETLPTPFSSLALLPKVSPRQLKPEDPIEHSDHNEFDLFANPPETSEPSPSRPFDWLLMALALVSLLSAAGLWIFVRTKLPQLTQATNVPTAEEVLQAKHDAEFLGYVRRSLERIDRVSKQTKAATDSRPATALDPLFVPLPPPPPAPIAPPIAAAPTPRISVSPLAATPVLPPASAPVAPSIAVAPVPAPASAPVAPSIPNIAPSPTHTLIGLLELGDRSAALFEIDGAPQRIQVGEKFGASGWTLISVSGEEAIVRRNQDVRSVFIGQKF
jgi:hypothetical protein